jgi:GNAT superfamily N-acetyltransferase
MTAGGGRVPRVTTRAGLAADELVVGEIIERARKELAPLRGGPLLVGGTTGPPAAEWLTSVVGDQRRQHLVVGAVDDAVVGAGLARLGGLDCRELLDRPDRLDRPHGLDRPQRRGGDGASAAGASRATEESLATIELLYVVPEARGVGVGEALLDDLLRWCGERGCDGVDVPALPGARETKNFLEAAHFSARLLVMHRSLPL